MKFIIFIISLGLTFYSCTTNNSKKNYAEENTETITKNEDRGIKDVLESYGGVCKYYLGKKNGLDGEKKFLEVELSKNVMVERSKGNPEMLASNVAYIFFRNLQSDANRYNEIRSTILYDNGEKASFNYSIKDLEIAKYNINIVFEIIVLLQNKKIDTIASMFEVENVQKNKIIETLKTTEAKSAAINKFVPYGFYILNNQLHASGVIIREAGYDEFSADMNMDTTATKIYNLKYKW